MKITIKDLVMKYQSKEVLHHINLQIEGPAIVGFLGHNGAGKTTLLNILSSLIKPTSGEIRINDEVIFDQADKMSQICFIAESGNFQDNLTINEVLKCNQLFMPNWDAEYAEELIIKFHLNKKAKVKSLSKGMVSALGIITGLASRAPVTIFDEPYIGLDAAGRNLFYDLLIEDYAEYPRIIIMSTHLIDEASELFNHVIIMQEGKILLQDDYISLQQKLVTVSGKKALVNEFIEGETIYFQSEFLNEKSVVMLNHEGIKKDTSGLKFEAVKLQELMILLSKQYREELYQ